MSSQASCNVLLTFSGRKHYMYSLLAASPWAGTIVATDSSSQAPIASRVPSFVRVAPASEEGAYVDDLARVCSERSIHCILSLNDGDLAVLARNALRFRALGVTILGAPLEAVVAMTDKLSAGAWLAEHGLESPETAPASCAREMAERHGFPLVAKARRGQGSAGLVICRSHDDLDHLRPEQVIQPFVGGDEYNLDVLRDAATGVVSVVPKRKLEMRDGSTHQAVSVRDRRLLELGIRLGNALQHTGGIDVDVIASEERIVILDVNPRVGGGFPYTAMCCARYVDALLMIGMGRSPAAFLGDYRVGVRGFRDVIYVRAAPGSPTEG